MIILYVYVMGDFNSDFTRGDLFGDEFMQMCNEHSLSIADKELLPDSSFTCISNAHGTTSWLDHCVTVEPLLYEHPQNHIDVVV